MKTTKTTTSKKKIAKKKARWSVGGSPPRPRRLTPTALRAKVVSVFRKAGYLPSGQIVEHGRRKAWLSSPTHRRLSKAGVDEISRDLRRAGVGVYAVNRGYDRDEWSLEGPGLHVLVNHFGGTGIFVQTISLAKKYDAIWRNHDGVPGTF